MSDGGEGDKSKTRIRPMPGGGFGQGDAKAPAPNTQKTVIGGAPAFNPGPGAGAVPSPAFGADWGGGAQPGGMPAQDPNAWMKPKAADAGFFPEAHAQPKAPEPVHQGRKISLDAALGATVTGANAESNPITAAAAGLLILFGRLRSQVVDMHALPLMNHVTQEIEAFEARVIDAGVDNHDAQVAKYCLAGTADDIVQNIPGTDHATWLQYAMVPRFFNTRTAGVGFFQEVDKALQNPAQKYHLLELMLTCLQLGFEGQYRTLSGGDVKLQEIKRGIYEALRRVRARGDDDISPAWKGIELAVRKRWGGTPIWVVAIFAASICALAYFAMRYLLVDEGNRLVTTMVSLHPTDQIELSRVGPVTAPVTVGIPEDIQAQEDRIREALEGEPVEVSGKGEFIALNINNVVLFDSGSADVKDDFAAVAAKITEALKSEPGPIKVIGHTDSVPPSGRGRFKTNQELSVARARSVADKIEETLKDKARLVVEGRGELEPVADNGTREGRAQNRRVEILLRREETLSKDELLNQSSGNDD